MIRIKLTQLLDDKAFNERRKISLQEVSQQTGIALPTLRRIMNVRGHNCELAAIDALCRYLQCQPGELLQWVDE